MKFRSFPPSREAESAGTLMKQELVFTREPIDETAWLSTDNPEREIGAALTFLGVVRGKENEAPIRGIEYEAFEAMARRQFELIFAQMAQKWPLDGVKVVHRLGAVPAGEPSLWVEVVARHRQEAFAAALYLVDEMKRLVPIWKRPLPARHVS